jgi:hypothetical protein
MTRMPLLSLGADGLTAYGVRRGCCRAFVADTWSRTAGLRLARVRH